MLEPTLSALKERCDSLATTQWRLCASLKPGRPLHLGSRVLHVTHLLTAFGR
jgi:hypothetical protein